MKLHRRDGLAPQLLKLCLTGLLLGLFLLTGCVISPRRDANGKIVGGAGGGSTPTPTPTPTPVPTPVPTPIPTPTPAPTPTGPQGKLYVTNESGNAIVRFDSAFSITGNVAPAAQITGANTHLSSPERLALDTVADRLFVANLAASSILVFDQISTKTGNIPPSREIVGPTTGLIQPVDLAYDKGRDMLYVSDGPEILVFNTASTATGDVAPARDLLLNFPVSGIFLDSADRLYVADVSSNAIRVFDGASTLNGAVTANRSLTGAATSLSAPSGILLDSGGKLIVSNAGSNAVTIYDNGATLTGNVAPSATIIGPSTRLSFPSQMTLNPNLTSGELYVANPFNGDITIFAGYIAANGNVVPTRDITGPATTLATTGTTATSRGIALDSTR